MDTCVRYPDYSSQGMPTNWMAPDSAGSSSRSKHGSWGPYGHDTTPITPSFPSYTHHAVSPPPGQAQGWGAAPEATATGWGSPYQPPNQVSYLPAQNFHFPCTKVRPRACLRMSCEGRRTKCIPSLHPRASRERLSSEESWQNSRIPARFLADNDFLIALFPNVANGHTHQRL